MLRINLHLPHVALTGHGLRLEVFQIFLRMSQDEEVSR